MITYKIQPIFLITHVCYNVLNYIQTNKKYSEEEREFKFNNLIKQEISNLRAMGLHKWLRTKRTSYQDVCIQFTRAIHPIMPIQELLVEGIFNKKEK